DRRLLVFVPAAQQQGAPGFFGATVLAVRTASDAAALAPAVRARISRIDPRVPVRRIDSIDREIDPALATERLVALLAIAFGVAALVITCVGLYAVVSNMAVRRVHEFGIRLALGAKPSTISSLMLREAMWLVAAGLVVGLPAALAAGRA